MKLKLYETISRYLLGLIYLFGAIDGVLFLFFGMYIHGKPHESMTFLIAMQNATYFWAFMKFIQLVGSLSLLTNYKPALGLALLTPITAVLSLFYIFELKWYYAFTVIVVLTIILLRAYSKSYMHLLDKYS